MKSKSKIELHPKTRTDALERMKQELLKHKIDTTKSSHDIGVSEEYYRSQFIRLARLIVEILENPPK